MTVELAARTPGPIIVVVDPTAIVIRRPTPRLLAHPGPPVRRNPNPAAVAIRRPVVVVVYDNGVRPPNPAIVVNVGPIAVGIEIFGAPNIAVVILNVVTKALGQVLLAFLYESVPGIGGIARHELPIAGIWSIDQQLRGTSVAQSETGRLGIDARATAIASSYTHASIADIDAIQSFFLG